MRQHSRTYFITGTDTGVGKTRFCSLLLHAAATAGLTTAAVKPVAAGAKRITDGLRNEDALVLQQAATLELSYEVVNPCCFEPAIAPHIAAVQSDTQLNLQGLAGFCRDVMMQRADLTLIEGAGGWHVPLNTTEKLSGLPGLLNVPVILVVGMKLGCLNHAQLTAEAIQAAGVKLTGWVANRIDPAMACYAENRETLTDLLPCPLLAEIPHGDFAESTQFSKLELSDFYT